MSRTIQDMSAKELVERLKKGSKANRKTDEELEAELIEWARRAEELLRTAWPYGIDAPKAKALKWDTDCRKLFSTLPEALK